MSVQPTCLFTDVTLTNTTKVEHTIPQSVCGRITSRSVTSDAFNENAGSRIDYTLKLIYEPMLNILSPLLPSSFQAGKMKVDIPGEPDGLVMEQGCLSRVKPIVEKDVQGKPIIVKAANRTPIDQIAKSLNKDPTTINYAVEPASVSPVFYKKVPVICRDVELAALKAALTTFDVLVSDHVQPFTRSSACANARTLLRRAVMENDIEKEMLGAISLGLQYEKIGLYRSIRAQLSVPITPFEHVMYVSSNLPSKSLDLVWFVFGFDPFGFRLSTEWSGEWFGYAVVNPILSGSQASPLLRFAPTDELLCQHTQRRSILDGADEHEMRNTLDFVSSERRRSYTEAVELVEMSADQHIAECMRENAEMATEGKQSAQSLIMRRLLRMFGRKQEEVSFRNEIALIVANEVASCSELAAIDDFKNASESDVHATISVYRRCLKSALRIYGPAGDAFQSSVGIVLDPSDQRLLGKLPSMM